MHERTSRSHGIVLYEYPAHIEHDVSYVCRLRCHATRLSYVVYMHFATIFRLPFFNVPRAQG